MSEEQMRRKAEAYCSAAERCLSEMEARLAGWGATPEAAAAILAHLQRERYVDQRRYCRAFVRDKFRFDRWGRVKIRQALRLKGMTEELVAQAMEEIDEREYLAVLDGLLRRKRAGVKAASARELRARLLRFAAGRGFEAEAAARCLGEEEDGDARPD